MKACIGKVERIIAYVANDYVVGWYWIARRHAELVGFSWGICCLFSNLGIHSLLQSYAGSFKLCVCGSYVSRILARRMKN